MKHQALQQQLTSLQANAQGDLALGIVDASAPAFLLNRGFVAAITDTDVGDLTLTFTNEQAAGTQAIVSITLLSATPGLVSVVPVAATGLQVLTWSCSVGMDADTAAADIDYWVRVTPVSAA